MPLYTYRCKKCGHEVEVLVVGGRGAPAKCPKCAGRAIERRFGGFSCGGGSGKQKKSSSCSAASCAPS
jgi:putative FmdB family regulatory protein